MKRILILLIIAWGVFSPISYSQNREKGNISITAGESYYDNNFNLKQDFIIKNTKNKTITSVLLRIGFKRDYPIGDMEKDYALYSKENFFALERILSVTIPYNKSITVTVDLTSPKEGFSSITCAIKKVRYSDGTIWDRGY